MALNSLCFQYNKRIIVCLWQQYILDFNTYLVLINWILVWPLIRLEDKSYNIYARGRASQLYPRVGSY